MAGPSDSAEAPPVSDAGGMRPQGPLDGLVGGLRRLDAGLLFIEKWMLVAASVVMLTFVAVNVVLRWTGQGLLAWAYELARFMMLWVAIIGASMATSRRRHIAIDILGKILPVRAKAPIGVAANLLAATVCFFIGVVALEYVKFTREGGGTSLSLHVPVWTVQLVLVSGFLFIGLRFLIAMLEDLNATLGGDASHLEHEAEVH